MYGGCLLCPLYPLLLVLTPFWGVVGGRRLFKFEWEWEGGGWGGVGAYSRLGANSRLGAYSNKYGKRQNFWECAGVRLIEV